MLKSLVSYAAVLVFLASAAAQEPHQVQCIQTGSAMVWCDNMGYVAMGEPLVQACSKVMPERLTKPRPLFDDGYRFVIEAHRVVGIKRGGDFDICYFIATNGEPRPDVCVTYPSVHHADTAFHAATTLLKER